MINLTDGETILSEIIMQEKSFDHDVLEDCLSSAIDQQADNECIYTHACLQHISDLESEFEADDLGGEYSAENWDKALQSYAYGLVRAALAQYAYEALNSLEAEVQLWSDEVERLGGDPDKFELGECQYGWEVHNYETNEGVMIWSNEKNHPNGCFNPNLLEGESIAVSFQVMGSTYINACWTPEREEA